MGKILNLGRKIIPRSVFKFAQPFYHFTLAFLAAVVYGFPSRKLKIIGVTGTKGKSTTVYFLSRILEEAGYKTAAISTIEMKMGEKCWNNKTEMTMPGRFYLQKFLRRAAKSGCKFAVLEVSSQGVVQHRHQFINFDTAVFTNLAPEHIEAHGSFKNYKKAKLKFFEYVKNNHVVNKDDKYFDDFWKVGYEGEDPWTRPIKKVSYSANDAKGIKLQIAGDFNLSNAAAAVKTAGIYGVSLEKAKVALENIKNVPGRMEFVNEGQNFKAIVDYAHTPESLEAAWKGAKSIIAGNAKLVCVFGATGGGRDKWKRPEFAKIAEKYCDEIILTNEDPYDENPEDILSQIYSGFSSVESVKSKVHKVLDRREAIKKAIELAKEGDAVIITGKGSQTTMAIAGGKKIPWSDKDVVSEELRKVVKDFNLR
ncbi:MAG: UDP-N-acetylmuramoyl-L-alanyl-D-glutamate--2,6-diaminopimelate ligase [Candidatus Pacebacteria bacterium]|nr:UDP-N-acetylmuramoyl-L-alanyl-D-glutamate--2,6-diaminopimelate ligase [Candidatus Paceibacterota bacterium]NUQ56896.1 UDP-N-acetylmuramoyl-L-alanyl-D-glutamate--2,6-diaminopimelate ligase [Candidatus Paceibacter sp.]